MCWTGLQNSHPPRLVEYDAVQFGKQLPTFRKNSGDSVFRVKDEQKVLHKSWYLSTKLHSVKAIKTVALSWAKITAHYDSFT